jgi:hypothetical protein
LVARWDRRGLARQIALLPLALASLEGARLGGTEGALVAVGLADAAAAQLAEARWAPTGFDPLAATGHAGAPGKCPFGFGS